MLAAWLVTPAAGEPALGVEVRSGGAEKSSNGGRPEYGRKRPLADYRSSTYAPFADTCGMAKMVLDLRPKFSSKRPSIARPRARSGEGTLAASMSLAFGRVIDACGSGHAEGAAEDCGAALGAYHDVAMSHQSSAALCAQPDLPMAFAAREGFGRRAKAVLQDIATQVASGGGTGDSTAPVVNDISLSLARFAARARIRRPPAVSARTFQNQTTIACDFGVGVCGGGRRRERRNSARLCSPGARKHPNSRDIEAKMLPPDAAGVANKPSTSARVDDYPTMLAGGFFSEHFRSRFEACVRQPV